MKALTISDSTNMILAIQDEIRRNGESRYDHRLHGVLLVAQGKTCPEVGRLLGDAPRTVEYWVQRFERRGLVGLTEGRRSGRPSRLSPEQFRKVEQAVRVNPREKGMETNLWDGKTLSAWIAKEWGVHLKVRQCQRLFRQLRFRLRKPRPIIAPADPGKQADLIQRRAEHKKTPRNDRRSHPRFMGN